MSILGGGSSSNNMGAPFFHEFKKQASFFFKEKIKIARLALTDVTPAELLTEEVTNGNQWAPDTRTLKIISRSAFEVDDYWRIVEILHKRLAIFDRKNWRLSYNALIVLEHLLTHGPESVAEEFQSDKDIMTEMESFQHIDEKGFNWGLNVAKKSERILKLLEKGHHLKEERDRARNLTRGIEGFGSLSQRTSSALEIPRESSLGTYGRSNSQFNDHGNEEDRFLDENLTKTGPHKNHEEKDLNLGSGKKMSFKENSAPREEVLTGDLHGWKWNSTGELKSLLSGQTDGPKLGISREEEDHPFNDSQHQATDSLLSTADQPLKGC